MTEAVIAGAVAGATAGAIAALAVLLASRRREPWRMYTWGARATPPEFVRGPQPSADPVRVFRASQAMSALSFERFDGSAKRVLGVAQDEAIQMNHNYVGTEHLLLGLIRGNADGPAGRVLVRLGVSLDKARTAVGFIIGKGDAPVGPAEITISPRARTVLALAIDEAHRQGHAEAGAADILLGLIREGQGIASGVIESLGVALALVRQAVHDEIGTGLRSPARGTPPPQPSPPAGETRTYRGPFDRFNDRAKRVLALAQDEAIRMNHNYIGPEHLLLGLVREGEGVAARALAGLGIKLSTSRLGVEKLIGRGEAGTTPTEITLTPRTKKVIELAIDESRLLGQNQVGTEHLLLGLIRDHGNNACEVLRSQGATLERIRHHVIARLEPPHEPPASAGGTP